MAVTTGFSLPYVGKYSESGGTVSYTGGMKLGRGVDMSVEVESADDNNFFADNIVAESETGTMTSASATVTIDGLEDDAAQFILGLPAAQEVTVGESQVEAYDYDNDLNPPYLGLGAIQRTMMNGVTKYRPILFAKVKFSIPSDSWATSEDQINWQTQELSATVQRDETAAANWKLISEEGMATEAEAEAAVKAFLNIVEA